MLFINAVNAFLMSTIIKPKFELSWLVDSGSTPMVLGSTLHGNEFQVKVKKFHSYVPHQNTGLRPSVGR
jgi:hypothetical protein